jgi:hypothetical protein
MVTLFLNKSLLTSMAVPVHYLAIGQMCTTCLLGAIKVYGGFDGAALNGGGYFLPGADGWHDEWGVSPQGLDPNALPVRC